VRSRVRTPLVVTVVLPQAAGMETGDPLGAVDRPVTVALARDLRHRAARMGTEAPGALGQAEAGRRATVAVRVRQATVPVRAPRTTEARQAAGMRMEALETVLQGRTATVVVRALRMTLAPRGLRAAEAPQVVGMRMEVLEAALQAEMARMEAALRAVETGMEPLKAVMLPAVVLLTRDLRAVGASQVARMASEAREAAAAQTEVDRTVDQDRTVPQLRPRPQSSLSTVPPSLPTQHPDSWSLDKQLYLVVRRSLLAVRPSLCLQVATPLWWMEQLPLSQGPRLPQPS